jgi:hypothetical protein
MQEGAGSQWRVSSVNLRRAGWGCIADHRRNSIQLPVASLAFLNIQTIVNGQEMRG